MRFGVRRKAASLRTSPRRQASDTTQLSANQQRRQRTASPMLQRAVTRIAHSARPTPVSRKSSGTSASGPTISRTGSRWWSTVTAAVITSRIVKTTVSRSPNHWTLPSR